VSEIGEELAFNIKFRLKWWYKFSVRADTKIFERMKKTRFFNVSPDFQVKL
jgi:hypothetical protein